MTPVELKTIRQNLGLSQRKLGEALGYSGRSIRHWESGQREIPLVVERAIKAYAYGGKDEN